MTAPGAALKPHPYAGYPYATGGVSCTTCGGGPGADQHDPSLLESGLSDVPREREAAPVAKPRPRIRIYLPGSYDLWQLLKLALAAAALAGAIMGDMWLSGHI